MIHTNKLTEAAIAEGKQLLQDDTARGCHGMDELRAALSEELKHPGCQVDNSGRDRI